MIVRKKAISRRTILRGIGAGLALPLLDSMIPAFSAMPAPVLRSEQAQELARHAVFLQRVAQPQIAFEVTMPTEPVVFECDGRLVSQALTNVLKNAVEAIAARMGSGDTTPGRIVITLEVKGARLLISMPGCCCPSE